METCAFCERTISNIYKMVRSPSRHRIYICDQCVDIASALIHDNISQKSMSKTRNKLSENAGFEMVEKKEKSSAIVFTMTPSEIHQQLDRYIIGQEKAKKVLSVAIYNHSKRLNDKTGLIKKSNILLAGPSGCGKTLLAKTVAKILDLPFTTVDATSLTAAGYIGNNVEDCLTRLLDIAKGDLEFAQKGVVFIDEIDKIAREGANRTIARDISHGEVQSALLRLIEGAAIDIEATGRKHPAGQHITFNTTNVLFICGGAFEGLFDSSNKNPLGFGVSSVLEEIDAKAPKKKLTTDALVKFGMMPEFVGRFPILCALSELKEDELIKVLTEPEDAITKEYELLFKKDGVKLIYEEDALREIVQLTIKQKTGARGLRSILEDVMLDIMYIVPDNKANFSKCIITKESISTKSPVLIEKKQRRKKAVTVTASS